jgi:pimeloyl-ACP methyl ester carboxylesterase
MRISVGNLTLGYDVVGSGPPLLMLMGLGANRRGWVGQVPALSAAMTLYLVDNRGVGESDKPPGPYRVREMADDARAFLDALEVESAHVLGVSMGGTIAQELALAYPERVRSLILACTFAKASRGMREISEETARSLGAGSGGTGAMREPGFQVSARQIAEAMMPFIFAPEFWARADAKTREALIGSYADGFSLQGVLGQVEAVLSHDVLGRLGAVRAPTLVLHGTADRLVRLHHGQRLAAEIPGAQMLEFEGGTHGFFVEQADAFNEAIVECVRGVEEERAEGAAPEVVEMPIDGTLDLHAFRPAEVKDLLDEYIRACLERGIREIRVIHGKGIGALRRTVHAALERHPAVAEFHLCDERSGGWGATRAVLRPTE